MSLIESMMVECAFINHVREDDAFGGYKETWSEGASFQAAIIKNSTTEALIAEKSGITELFTIVTKKSIVLDYHDVIMRKSDSEIFRVTSRAKDSVAPEMSSVPIAKVSAERWVLPT